MREIKFRAYWKPGKIMILSEKIESVNFETKVLGVYHPIGNIGFHKLRMSNFELMQFTGLLDRNGKDVYEGDIVNHGSEHHYTEVIIFVDGCFGTQEFHMDDVVPCEVIGNIYENPELLEETK